MTDEIATEVAEDAFEAYREANPLLPTDSLSYDEARKHDNGDGLADFLVIELTEGIETEEGAEQYKQGLELIGRAIGDLQAVQSRLEERHYEQQPADES